MEEVALSLLMLGKVAHAALGSKAECAACGRVAECGEKVELRPRQGEEAYSLHKNCLLALGLTGNFTEMALLNAIEHRRLLG